MGRIIVKGLVAPIELSEVVALREDATDQMRECIALYEQGFVRYWERDWTGAITLFEKSASLERDQPGSSPEIVCNPSTVSLTLARECLANPPTVLGIKQNA